MKENSYVLISGILFKRIMMVFFNDDFLLKKTHEILREIHKGVCGSNFSPNITAHHITRDGYYCPTIFKDSYSFIKKCPACQIVLEE